MEKIYKLAKQLIVPIFTKHSFKGKNISFILKIVMYLPKSRNKQLI